MFVIEDTNTLFALDTNLNDIYILEETYFTKFPPFLFLFFSRAHFSKCGYQNKSTKTKERDVSKENVLDDFVFGSNCSVYLMYHNRFRQITVKLFL